MCTEARSGSEMHLLSEIIGRSGCALKRGVGVWPEADGEVGRNKQSKVGIVRKEERGNNENARNANGMSSRQFRRCGDVKRQEQGGMEITKALQAALLSGRLEQVILLQ